MGGTVNLGLEGDSAHLGDHPVQKISMRPGLGLVGRAVNQGRQKPRAHCPPARSSRVDPSHASRFDTFAPSESRAYSS